AASGHAAVAPASTAMKSRRFTAQYLPCWGKNSTPQEQQQDTALRNFDPVDVWLGSFTSFLPSRRVRFAQKAATRPKLAFTRTRPSARTARSEPFRFSGCGFG